MEMAPFVVRNGHAMVVDVVLHGHDFIGNKLDRPDADLKFVWTNKLFVNDFGTVICQDSIVQEE